MTFKRYLTHVLACVVLSASSLLFISSPAQAATARGGVSMWAACQNQYAKGWESYIQDRNAYGWRCGFRPYPNVFQKAGRTIDVNMQCAVQYGKGAWGKPSNVNDPYSWVCYR